MSIFAFDVVVLCECLGDPRVFQMAAKQTSLVIAGLEINIYSLSNSDSQKPVVIFFLLHGRYGSTEVVDPFARSMIEQIQWAEQEYERELLIVTFVSKVDVLKVMTIAHSLRHSGPPQPWKAPYRS
jgi:hypothetical protein